MKKLSIIIVTYNSSHEIIDCLDAIYKHNDIADALEVILVDNNSKDFELMQASVRQRFGEEVVIIQNTLNSGYGKGNNIGVSHASAPYVMIMNPDVRMLTTSFADIVKTFDNNAQLAMIGFKQMETPQKAATSFAFVAHANGFLRSWGNLICNRFDWYFPKMMYFAGACFAIRKNTFDAIGGFDEHIFLYGEENDLHWRITHLTTGNRLQYCNTIQYLHPTHHRDFSVKNIYRRIQSNMYIFRKHGINPAIYLRSEISRLTWSQCLFWMSQRQKDVLRQELNIFQKELYALKQQ